MTPVSLFPEIYSLDDFYADEDPRYHPDTRQYARYWKNEEIRCIEGVWGSDSRGNKGGWRYMPGNLYWYVNYCQIADEDERGNAVAYITPMLRDVEWILGYAWTIARGFSGFEDDDEYSCSTLLNKSELTKKDQIRYDRLKEHLLKKNGKPKTYIDPFEYLSRTHYEPKGKPLYDNDARNLMVLGARGFGKSYFTANVVIGHEYNFYGKKYYNELYLDDPAGVEIFVGAAIAAKSSDLLKKFTHTQEYLKRNFGAYGKDDDFIPGYFTLSSTGTLAANNAKSPYRHEYKQNVGGTWLKRGTGTKIHHGIYTSENPQAAVGTRPTVMVVEEAGLASNLLDIHLANETCMIRRNKFGSAMIIGTGGNIEKIHDARVMFEDPESYSCVPFTDHWENRIKPIGLFMPAYYVDNDFKDELGNTDIQAAFAHEMAEREKRKKANNSYALDGYRMARPLVPSEMFLSRESMIFPVDLLRRRYNMVVSEDLFKKVTSIGRFAKNGDEYIWREDVSRVLNPIVDLATEKMTDLTGAVVVYEHPEDNIPDPTYYRSLYKVVYDPVKDDVYGTSLACILVYKGYPVQGWNMGMSNTIVAEYFGRMSDVEDIHEVALALAEYYNAKVMVETNVPDFIRYCKRIKKAHLLQRTPYRALSKALKNPGRKYGVGVEMSSKFLKIHAEQLLNTYLQSKTPDNKTAIDMIYSPRLLLEAIHYERNRNFDGISALFLLMLWISQEHEEPISPDIRMSAEKLAEQRKKRKLRYIKHINNRSRPFHVY